MVSYAPILVEGPAGDPVTIDEIKMHLRIDGSDEDALLELYRAAAVSHLDGPTGWLNRALVTQTWALSYDGFARTLLISPAPVASIVAVKYFDEDGVEQTVSETDYTLVNPGSSPEVRFVDDYAFPSLRDDAPRVTITFVSGYGAAAAVPGALKAAILLMVGDMFESREAKLPTGFIENSTVRRLLDPYRRGWVA